METQQEVLNSRMDEYMQWCIYAVEYYSTRQNNIDELIDTELSKKKSVQKRTYCIK